MRGWGGKGEKETEHRVVSKSTRSLPVMIGAMKKDLRDTKQNDRIA